MSSASSSAGRGGGVTTLADFWKDDFAPLQFAGRAVLHSLREEEAADDADLYRRMSSSGVGSHLYFPSPSPSSSSAAAGGVGGLGGGTGAPYAADDTAVTSTVEHVKSLPLPPLLAEELKAVKSHSFMGLLAPASLAWMSVDDKVFLWPFQEQGSFFSFQVPSGQSVIAVGLIRSKKGVFNSTVSWCLVITTPDEVLLCALQMVTNGVDGGTSGGVGMDNMAAAQPPDNGGLRLVPTSFRLATDNVRMLSVCGTETGRIFLGGDDGCLYEMTYQGLKDQQPSSSVSVEERLNQFYDEGEDAPAVLTIDSNSNVAQNSGLGKRAWNVLSSSSSSSASYEGGRPHKCRKLNRTSNVSSWVSAVLPDFVGSLLPKTATGGGRIERMVIDEDRKCLYTLSSAGWICSFDLRPLSGGTDSVRLAAVMQTPRTARLYLEAVSRGQMLAPSTHGSTLGYINFPGGGSAAKAGVGGMEGARAILKAADLGAKTNSRSPNFGGEDILKPISIHVVPPTESQRLTLMAVTAGGLRLYLSSLAANILSSGTNYSSGRQSNPLAPSSRLTLCHVRAPPPSDLGRSQNLSSSVDAGVLGGIKPQVVMGSASEKIPRVDATFYKQGVYVAAVESRAKQGAIVAQQPASGDVVVTACPDSVARKVETPEEQNKQTLTIPGGITETTSMPMLSAYGTNADDNKAVLSGGLVWDMAPVGDEETAVMRLTWNSQTPTDTELSVGLPPAYFPPSKIRARDISRTPTANGGYTTPRNNLQVVAIQNTSLSSTAMKMLGNVITNMFLPRPIRQGITFQPPSLQSDFYPGARLSREYRISKRNGSSGFSTTAGESSRYSERNHTRSPSKVTRASRSARLRPWLLRPAAVPLNQFSTQHLTKPKQKQVVALNAGGLHYFCINSVLFNLADALTSAVDVRTDRHVSSFFTSYGYKEGCAMCLALAIGCGPAAGNSNNSEQLRIRASVAAGAHAYRPMLVVLSDQNGQDNKSVTTSSDSLIPNGYGFFPSELSNGLTALTSRLLRCIWYKPAVVVTEGRMIKQQQWSSKTRSTPAKVELLLSESTLEDIRSPLRNLLSLMKNRFHRAVEMVPGVPENQGSMMDIETENGENQYFTRAIQYRSQLHAGDGVAANQLSPAEKETIACLIEDKNIHSLYRLLSRVVQLLNLISLLQRAQSMSELREVDWGLLHGLTISQLVQTPDGQERIESLLNALVTTSASDGIAMPSAQADQLANQFADQCYLYFSPGSRSAYLGIKDANEALSCPIGSSRRASLGNMAANHLRVAAKHWYSAPLVTGRILHPKDHENFQQIAFRAMQYGSPLAKAVDALMKLEDVGSVVDVCLMTASNFNENVPLVNASADGLQSNASSYELPWEQHLYHKRRDLETNETATSTSRALSTPSSPTQVVAYGTTVTSKDAVDTCYALIFHYLSILLGSNPQLADRMVSACADDSNDDSFLNAFFRFLLESDCADTLLRINSPKLDKWLRVRNDPDLLWRYCNVQGKLFEAAEVSLDRAENSRLKLPLSERIDCLTRALNALEREQPSSYAFHSADDIQKKIKEVHETLLIAKIQNRILQSVHSLKAELKLDLTAERLERLETSLVPATELFNDYAAAFSLFEHCLLIIQACHYDQANTIEGLWKNIVCEEILPCATRREGVQSFLQQFVVDLGLCDSITFLNEQTPNNSQMLFESGDWSKRLEMRVVELGKELYIPGDEYVFPVDFLLGVFEELRECAGRSVQANWSLFVLARVGVPFLVILDAYESFIQRDESNFMAMGANQLQQGDQLRHKRIEQISNIIDLIDYWVNSARNSTVGGDGMNETARTELSRAVASGLLMPKLDGIRSKLETMPNSSGLVNRVRAIEETIQYL